MREEIRHIQALMEGAAYITDPCLLYTSDAADEL